MSKIALVVGHTPSKPGAIGNSKVSEYKFNKELVEEVVASCELSTDNEYKVFYRNPALGFYGLQMEGLHTDIDDWGADISIEFHFNGAGDPEVNGHEVLYCSSKGQAVAEVFDTEFDEQLPNRDRNLKKITSSDRGGGFVCRGNSAAIILEPFFASHQHLYMHDGEERANLVQSIVNSLNKL